MATVKLAPNLAVTMKVNYADIVPTQYGPELRLKGEIGDDKLAFVYLKTTDALTQLKAVGAITELPDFDADNLPEKGLAVRLAKHNLVIVKEQSAGEKHPTLKISLPGAPQVAAGAKPAQSTPPAAAKSKAPVGEEAPSIWAQYLRAQKFALEHVLPAYQERQIPITMEGTTRIVGDLFATLRKETGQ